MNISRFDHDTYHTDYPWDECGDPSENRSLFYCPCNEMEIVRIYHRDKTNSYDPNVIWLTSTSKVKMANGLEDIVTIMIMHGEDKDINILSKGQTFTRG